MNCEVCGWEFPVDAPKLMPCMRCWAIAHGWTVNSDDSISPPKRTEVAEETFRQKVNKLREQTGAGFADCKRALLKMGNDPEVAKVYLRNLGRCIVYKYENEPIPEYGNHMTLGHFISLVRSGGFIDDDGVGRYATAKTMTQFPIYPSDISKRPDELRTWFTHVVWFND